MNSNSKPTKYIMIILPFLKKLMNRLLGKNIVCERIYCSLKLYNDHFTLSKKINELVIRGKIVFLQGSLVIIRLIKDK
jgi:hypothetical protein